MLKLFAKSLPTISVLFVAAAPVLAGDAGGSPASHTLRADNSAVFQRNYAVIRKALPPINTATQR